MRRTISWLWNRIALLLRMCRTPKVRTLAIPEVWTPEELEALAERQLALVAQSLKAMEPERLADKRTRRKKRKEEAEAKRREILRALRAEKNQAVFLALGMPRVEGQLPFLPVIGTELLDLSAQMQMLKGKGRSPFFIGEGSGSIIQERQEFLADTYWLVGVRWGPGESWKTDQQESPWCLCTHELIALALQGGLSEGRVFCAGDSRFSWSGDGVALWVKGTTIHLGWASVGLDTGNRFIAGCRERTSGA